MTKWDLSLSLLVANKPFNRLHFSIQVSVLNSSFCFYFSVLNWINCNKMSILFGYWPLIAKNFIILFVFLKQSTKSLICYEFIFFRQKSQFQRLSSCFFFTLITLLSDIGSITIKIQWVNVKIYIIFTWKCKHLQSENRLCWWYWQM